MADGRAGKMDLSIAKFLDMTLHASRTGIDTIFPESLKRRLASFSILEDVGEPAMKRLLAEADWFGLPGGTLLPRDGENDRAVFLVVAGSLGVMVEDEHQGPKRMVATVPAGETVGEMSL